MSEELKTWVAIAFMILAGTFGENVELAMQLAVTGACLKYLLV